MTDVNVVELVQRIAKLEAGHAHLAAQSEAVTDRLDKLLTRFDKYEAKWGGVLMVVSALSAIGLAFKGEVMRWLSR